jgi:hypothetical protein
MPEPPTVPTTHIPGTDIALGLAGGPWANLHRRVHAGFTVLAAMLIVVALIGCVIAIVYAARAAGPLFAIVPASILVGLVVFLYRAAFRKPPIEIPDRPSDSARIAVVGTPHTIARLLKQPVPNDEAFEPIVLKAEFPWYIHGMFIILVIALLVPMRSVAPRMSATFGGWSPFVLMMAVATVPLALRWLFPRFYRFSPGRMDILSGGLLHSRLRLRESIDLRSSRVLVDLNGRYLRVTSPAGRVRVIDLPDQRGRATLVPEILRAAISTAPAAPLPDDALVG